MSDQHDEVAETELVEEVTPGSDVVPSAPGLAPAPPPAQGGELATLWNTRDPGEIIKQVGSVATALKDVIDKQELSVALGGKKKHVEIEGWQTAGTLLGLQAMTVSTARVHPMTSYVAKAKRKKYGWVNGKREVTEETEFEYAVEGWSWEAVAEVRTMDGRLVGRGEAICSREEENWFDSSESAVKGMAQTRAQSRALRQALGFIVGMAGYETTGAEEVKANGGQEEGAPAQAVAAATKEQADLLSRALSWLFEEDHKAAEAAYNAASKVTAGTLAGVVADGITVVLGARKRKVEGAEEAAKKETAEQKRRRERKEKADAKKAAEAAQAAAEEGDPPAPDDDPPAGEDPSPEAPDTLPGTD
jgi:hypothetical protein